MKKKKIPKSSAKRLEYAKEYRTKLKQSSIDAYGGQCVCCGESNIVFLTIDHINNDGARHREEMGYFSHGRMIGSGNTMHAWLKKNNYPEGFQILCANCNMGKQSMGTCPHQMESKS